MGRHLKRGRGRLIDLTGRVFGIRRVVGRAANDERGNARWDVVCACKAVDTVKGALLLAGGGRACRSCAYRGRTYATRTLLEREAQAEAEVTR